MMVLNTLAVRVETDTYIYDGVEHPGSQVGAGTYIYDGVEHPGSQIEADTYVYDGVEHPGGHSRGRYLHL